MLNSNKTLAILQYNIRNDKDSIMISLLADPRILQYDVLAIQKSWRNAHVSTTYNSSRSGFHLAYKSGGDTRVCFYINSRIDPES